MSDFERISYFFSKGWAKIPQLRQYVQFNMITPEQFKTITDQDY